MDLFLRIATDTVQSQEVPLDLQISPSSMSMSTLSLDLGYYTYHNRVPGISSSITAE